MKKRNKKSLKRSQFSDGSNHYLIHKQIKEARESMANPLLSAVQQAAGKEMDKRKLVENPTNNSQANNPLVPILTALLLNKQDGKTFTTDKLLIHDDGSISFREPTLNVLRHPNDIKRDLIEAANLLSQSPLCQPGYGAVDMKNDDSGEVWWTGNMNDGEGFGELVIKTLSRIPGVSTVTYRREIPPEREAKEYGFSQPIWDEVWVNSGFDYKRPRVGDFAPGKHTTNSNPYHDEHGRFTYSDVLVPTDNLQERIIRHLKAQDMDYDSAAHIAKVIDNATQDREYTERDGEVSGKLFHNDLPNEVSGYRKKSILDWLHEKAYQHEPILKLKPPINNFNPNHDNMGRFSTSDSTGSGVSQDQSHQKESILKRGISLAKGVIKKYNEAYDKVTSVWGLRHIRMVGDFNKKMTKKWIGFLSNRYGKVNTTLIMASAQPLGWGALVGFGIGLPKLYLPAVSIWGSLPAVAVAEGLLQTGRGAKGLFRKVTGRRPEMATNEYGDTVTLNEEGFPELTIDQARKIAKKGMQKLWKQHVQYLIDHQDEFKGIDGLTTNERYDPVEEFNKSVRRAERIANIREKLKERNRCKLLSNSNPNHDDKGRFTFAVDDESLKNHITSDEGKSTLINHMENASKEVVGNHGEGPCDIVTYALWKRLGEPKNLLPHKVVHNGEDHAILLSPKTGIILDPTSGQYNQPKINTLDKSPYKVRKKFSKKDLRDSEEMLDIHKDMLTSNAFCPTGEGGGVDPSCSPHKEDSDGTKSETDHSATGGSNGKGNEGTSSGIEGSAVETGRSAAGEGGVYSSRSTESGTYGYVPRTVVDAVDKVNRYEKFFRDKGQHQLADWMGKLRDHIKNVGTDESLKSLGDEIHSKSLEEETKHGVMYGGVNLEGKADAGFIKAYLQKNGIIPVHMGDKLENNGKRLISSLAPATGGFEGIESRGEHGAKLGDVYASLQTLKHKLDEAQHLPGLETSEDIHKIMGHEVKTFTPDVIKKLDEKYGKDQWIVKSYGDEAYAGYGIFFPQRVAALPEMSRNVIHGSGPKLAQYGFSHLRDASTNEIVGIKHTSGDEYKFGTEKYENTIHGEVRKVADDVAKHAPHEVVTTLPEGSFMAQPAFPVVGISDAERAAGITFKKGQEGRVHIVTRNGQTEVVPHSTWLKEEHLPVVFENDETRAMAKTAKDAIDALPHSEKQGQVYAPDIVKTKDGYKVVEANPANEAGASGYLADNPMIIDAFVSHHLGREPAHVKFIRKLLTTRVHNMLTHIYPHLVGNAKENAAKLIYNYWVDNSNPCHDDKGQFCSDEDEESAGTEKTPVPKFDENGHYPLYHVTDAVWLKSILKHGIGETDKYHAIEGVQSLKPDSYTSWTRDPAYAIKNGEVRVKVNDKQSLKALGFNPEKVVASVATDMTGDKLIAAHYEAEEATKGVVPLSAIDEIHVSPNVVRGWYRDIKLYRKYAAEYAEKQKKLPEIREKLATLTPEDKEYKMYKREEHKLSLPNSYSRLADDLEQMINHPKIRSGEFLQRKYSSGGKLVGMKTLNARDTAGRFIHKCRDLDTDIPDSSCIDHIQYDCNEQNLSIHFVNGKTDYDFPDIPPSTVALMLSSPSKGSYYNEEIRNQILNSFVYNEIDYDKRVKEAKSLMDKYAYFGDPRFNEAEKSWRAAVADRAKTKSGQSAESGDNCGTGYGGFKPGNTCAIESGGKGQTKSPTTTKKEVEDTSTSELLLDSEEFSPDNSIVNHGLKQVKSVRSSNYLDTIIKYTHTKLCYEVVDAMRKVDGDISKLPKSIKSKVEEIERGLEQADGLDKPRFVYRGIGCEDPSNVAKVVESFKKCMKDKKQFQMPSIISTSVDMSRAIGFAKAFTDDAKQSILFRIKAKTGMYIDSISKKKREYEVLKSSKSEYKVVGVSIKTLRYGKGTLKGKLTKQGLTIVDLEEV